MAKKKVVEGGGEHSVAFSKEQILNFHKLAVKKYYLRPLYILKMLTKIRSLYELKSYFTAGIKILLNR